MMSAPSSARLAPPGTKWRQHCRCGRSSFRSTPNRWKRVWPSGREELLTTNNRLQVEVTEREKTEAALLQSQKLQAVGQLAGGIAHDFNNLLATIQGCLDLIARTISEEQSQQRAWVQRATGAVSRGAQLTGRLLAFSRRRRLSVRSTDVNQLVTDLVALFGAATLGRRISVVTNLGSDVRSAVVEPSQLEAALLNLALNARDAMPEGGVLTFATSNEILAEAADDLPAGEYISITVVDTGVGMDQDVERRALDPFFTTKGASGTGLGPQPGAGHGRRIRRRGAAIHTRPGQGTCVTLLLPRAVETAMTIVTRGHATQAGENDSAGGGR